MASTATVNSRSRGSDSASFMEGSTVTLPYHPSGSPDHRKPKGINIFNALKKKASRIGREDSASSISLVPPPMPSPGPVSYTIPVTPPPPPVPRKEKGRRRIHPKSLGHPLPKEPEFTLDTNLNEMEGIVDLTIRSDARSPNGEGSSPGSGFETSNVTTSSLSISDNGVHSGGSTPFLQPIQPQPMFNNPFSKSSSIPSKRKHGPPSLELRKVSPKTIIPSSSASQNDAEQHSPGWTAPESWAVEKKDGESVVAPDYSTSDEEDPTNERTKPSRRRTRNPAKQKTVFQIRVHRVDGSYHVVKCPLETTVAELIPNMNKKLVLDSTRETHSLYVKERERGA